MNPADIDSNALELLKSGIMNVADYSAMLDRYSGNSTMLRLIGKYADELRQTITEASTRQQIAAIAIRAKESSTDEAGSWRELADAAKIYSGARSPRSPGYGQSTQKHREDAAIQAAIANF